MIFCTTKRMCDQLSHSIAREFRSAAIHGDKRQQERDFVLNQFKTVRPLFQGSRLRRSMRSSKMARKAEQLFFWEWVVVYNAWQGLVHNILYWLSPATPTCLMNLGKVGQSLS
jgi:hypothetical protein